MKSKAKKVKGQKPNWSLLWKFMKQDYQLYLFMIPAVIFFSIFAYAPMYGVQIAFKDFNAAIGVAASPWVGLDHFVRLFSSNQFKTILINTLTISIYTLVVSFPIPIIFALFITQVRNKKFKNFVQTITYAPHFISIVVLIGMLNIFLSPSTGIINMVITSFGGEAHNFMGDPNWFKHLYVISDVWQHAGWSSIIFVAALSSVSPELYEAAALDGASRFKQIIHIDLPSIMPTAVIMLLLSCGQIMNQGAEKAFLMQNALTAGSQELISTYIYKMGIMNNQFSYSTALGLFNSVVNIILLVLVNTTSKKLTETSLW